MWVFDQSLFYIILRTAIIYAVVLIGLRATGKREVGQMTPFDLVLLLLISNAVQNAMVGDGTSVSGGIVAVITLLVINTIFSQVVRKNRRVRKIVEGTPTILIHSGKLIEANSENENLTLDDLHQALREHGVANINDVGLAVLEIDGSISVLKNDEMPNGHLPHHRIKLLQRKH